MYIVENAITEETWSTLLIDIKDKFHNFCWKSSTLTWESNIKTGIIGTCLTTPVGHNLSAKILNDLDGKIKMYSRMACQYYVWHPLSGISRHNDGIHKISGTIYLNKHWHSDWGGQFNWEEDDKILSIIPKKRSMVVNDDHTYHWVTPLSPLTPYNRFTIQIWGNEL